MSTPQRKIGVLVAAGAAALIISGATGCKVEIGAPADGTKNSGGGSGDAGSRNSGSGDSGSGGPKGTNGSGGTSPNGSTKGTTSPLPTTKPSKAMAPGISLSRSSVLLPCPSRDCSQQVTIRSTGTAPLEVYNLVILDDADFKVDKVCTHQELQPGESCTFNVSYQGAPSDNVHTARLVIHQNLPGQPTYIALTKHPVPVSGE
jgi:hypothetical protein